MLQYVMNNYNMLLNITGFVVILSSITNLVLPFLILVVSISRIGIHKNKIMKILVVVSLICYLLLALSFIPYWTSVNYEQSFLSNRQPLAIKEYDFQKNVIERKIVEIMDRLVQFRFLEG